MARFDRLFLFRSYSAHLLLQRSHWAVYVTENILNCVPTWLRSLISQRGTDHFSPSLFFIYIFYYIFFFRHVLGNYGVPSRSELDEFGLPKFFESDKIQVAGVIVSDYSHDYQHYQGLNSLSEWLKEHVSHAIVLCLFAVFWIFHAGPLPSLYCIVYPIYSLRKLP